MSVVRDGIFQHIILKILILQRKPETRRDHLSPNLPLTWHPGKTVVELCCRLVDLASVFSPLAAGSLRVGLGIAYIYKYFRVFYFSFNYIAFQQYNCLMAFWDVPAQRKCR